MGPFFEILIKHSRLDHVQFNHDGSCRWRAFLCTAISRTASCSDVPHCGSSLPTDLWFWLAGRSNIQLPSRSQASLFHQLISTRAHQKVLAEANTADRLFTTDGWHRVDSGERNLTQLGLCILVRQVYVIFERKKTKEATLLDQNWTVVKCFVGTAWIRASHKSSTKCYL